MLHSIISEYDILCKSEITQLTSSIVPSSNPYDYIRRGYFLDKADLYGGNNNVIYNCNISVNRSGGV